MKRTLSYQQDAEVDENQRTDVANEEEATSPSNAPQSNLFSRYAFQLPPQRQRPNAWRTKGESPSGQSPGERVARPSEDEDHEDTTTMSAAALPSSSKKIKIYHNLRGINDYLDFGLDIIFCGINPGKKSAEISHHFANPTNHFWDCLHHSGLTARKLDPREDYTLPTQFSIGLTNLVERPTVEQIELSRKEQTDGVPVLLTKIRQYRPLVVCFIGLGIANVVKSKAVIVERTKGSKVKSPAAIGLQTYKMVHEPTRSYSGSTITGPSETLFYAVSSTSGRVVKYQKTDKIQQFKDLQALTEQIKNGGMDTTNLIAITNNTANDSNTTNEE